MDREEYGKLLLENLNGGGTPFSRKVLSQTFQRLLNKQLMDGFMYPVEYPTITSANTDLLCSTTQGDGFTDTLYKYGMAVASSSISIEPAKFYQPTTLEKEYDKMSTEWGFKCRTCDKETIGTKQKDACIDLLQIAPQLKALFASAHSRILDIRFNMVYWLSFEDDDAPTEYPFKFVAEHADHDLVVINEYGKVLNTELEETTPSD